MTAHVRKGLGTNPKEDQIKTVYRIRNGCSRTTTKVARSRDLLLYYDECTHDLSDFNQTAKIMMVGRETSIKIQFNSNQPILSCKACSQCSHFLLPTIRLFFLSMVKYVNTCIIIDIFDLRQKYNRSIPVIVLTYLTLDRKKIGQYPYQY